MSMPGSAWRKSTWRTEVRRGASNPPSSPPRFLQASATRPEAEVGAVPQSRRRSEPPVAGEVQAQRLLLGGAQLLQGGAAGASVVAKPVHGFLQSWDPEAPGHLRSSAC